MTHQGAHKRRGWIGAAAAGPLLIAAGWFLLVIYWPLWVATHHGEGANLAHAYLPAAGLSRAKLNGAILCRVYLREAILQNADLRGADLRGADLRDTWLYGADLRGADLRDADLRGSGLAEHKGPNTLLPAATLVGARYNEHTRWPAHFDPARHGAVRD